MRILHFVTNGHQWLSMIAMVAMVLQNIRNAPHCNKEERCCAARFKNPFAAKAARLPLPGDVGLPTRGRQRWLFLLRSLRLHEKPALPPGKENSAGNT
jgi:hypothetical protein